MPPERKPAAAGAAKPEAKSWDDQMADALPKRSNFYSSLRTHAYANNNLVENYIEFWAALKVDAAADKWRVMHYMIYDLDQADGKFVVEFTQKDKETGLPKDLSFAEAVFQLSRAEYTASKMLNSADKEIQTRYPADKHPELQAYYYDLEYYKPAANIEGFAFDEYNQPYRRIEGKVFSEATFKRSEIVKSIIAVEHAREDEKLRPKIEGGILSDIFATKTERFATLNGLMEVARALTAMDDFAVTMAAGYLMLQKIAGVDHKLDKVSSLSLEENKKIYDRALAQMPYGLDDRSAYKSLTEDLLPRSRKILSDAGANGLHTEPYLKFASEMELYANMLHATHNLSKMEKGLLVANNTDINLMASVQTATEKAQKIFLDLGGTEEQTDKLTAWISTHAREEKDPVRKQEMQDKIIPPWIPGFLTRYYAARERAMKTVQERKSSVVREVKTMAVDVKPPVADEFNANAEKPAERANFEKFKDVMNDDGGRKDGPSPGPK